MTPQPIPVDAGARFEVLLVEVEPGLRRALVAAYGVDAGREAAAEALAWAWEHRVRVQAMSNPAGYLWRVGQTAARKGRGWSSRRSDVALPEVAATEDRHPPEPRLAAGLAALSHHQRAAVVLVYGWGYTLDAAAAVIGCKVSSLRNHLQRGLAKLQTTLGADDA